MAQNENNKILLHACCGICSGYPISLLKEMGYSPVVYFCNPNIDTKDEFIRRLDAQKTVCNNFDTKLIIEEYSPNEYLNAVKGFEQEPERGKRCDICIALRLNMAGIKTKELGLKKFTTSLVISPHKNFNKISALGCEIADKYNLEYLSIDFKKKDGFLKTNIISKELGLYRQKYCGCKYAKPVYNLK